MKNTKNKNKKTMYWVGIVIIILFLLMITSTSKNKKREEEALEQTPEQVTIQEKENITDSVKNMAERDRMEYYFGMFLGYIEKDEYEKAYDLLYPEFKKNYFPTLKSFEEYIPTVFSEMSNIEHNNLERNGDVYVLWIYITDALNGKPGEKREMKVVIKENDYNDFVLSFSKI